MPSIIPLASQRVSPISDIGTGQVSAAPSVAIGQAISGFGDLAFNLGSDYIEKKRSLKKKADISDYEVSSRNFQNELLEKKNKAMLEDHVGYQDVYDKVVSPAIDEFESELMNRGYSNDSISDIRQRWGLDKAQIAQQEIQDRESMELQDYTSRLRDQMWVLQSSPDPDIDAIDEVHGTISGVVGVSKADQWRSQGYYDNARIEAQAMEEQALLGNVSDEEYFSYLDGEYNSLAESDKLQGNHKRSLQIEFGSKKNNYMKKRMGAFEKAKNRFTELSIRGDVTARDYEELVRDAGLPFANGMANAAMANLEAKAATDKDAKAAIGWLNKMTTGDSVWPETLRKVSRYGDGIGELAVIVAGNLAVDLSKDQNATVGYEFMRANKKFAIGGYTSDFVGKVNDYALLMDGGQASFVNDKLKAIANWQKLNPNPTEDDYRAFVSEQFKKVATEQVRKISAPYAPSDTTQPDFDNMTDEELEAYLNE